MNPASGLDFKRRSRSFITLALSLVAGIGLIVVLPLASSVRWQEVIARSLAVDRMAFLRLALLFALSSFLSSEKWRMTDRVICHGEGDPVPRSTAFVLTTVGVALGQFLPIQVTMSLARTLGTFVHGRALRRGTVATLFEQSFDLFVTVLMVMAAAGTRLLRGGAALWLALALAGAVLAVSAVGTLMNVADWLTARLAAKRTRVARWRSAIAELRESGLFQAGLARRLTLISLARFVLLVLMASQVSTGIHLAIPLWRLASAVPFGLLVAVAGITPGGLGLAEAANAAALDLSGIPLAVSTQWAIANRLLSIAAVFVVAGFGVVLLVARKVFPGSRTESPQNAAQQ